MTTPCECFACHATVGTGLAPHGFCGPCAERAARGRRRFLVVALGLGVIRPERLTEAIVHEIEREAGA